jgi:UPF0176 protein
MEKVILFYKFVPLKDHEMARLWQIELCTRLALRGRIIVSPQGINGTLGGDLESLRAYKRAMNTSGVFRGIHYKWSDGTPEDFPKLSVKAKKELVAFGAENEVEVTETGVVGTGKHLSPEALHKLLAEKGEDVVFFDGRNAYEAEVGKFENAVVPEVKTSKDFIKEIESPKYDQIKNKPVVTYCTGGIRCEVLSALMKKRGFKEVYQIDGGIVKYGEKYQDKGRWKGKLYVFDKRMITAFSEDSEDIGRCSLCQSPTSNFMNCDNLNCNKLVVACEACSKKGYCKDCLKATKNKKINIA